MFVVVLPFSLVVIAFIISLLVFGGGSLFMKISKKQYREWWAQQRPGLPLPAKYRYDPNDPDDDKPKMGFPGKFIIGMGIGTAALIFIIISLLYVGPKFGIDIVKSLNDLSDRNLKDETVLRDEESKISYSYQASDINDKIINVSFGIRYIWSAEKEKLYENNTQVEDYIKSFFKTKDINYAFIEEGPAKGYLKDSIIEEWGGPILQYMRDLFTDESIKYYRSSIRYDKFNVRELRKYELERLQ
jgi:hypothetical protein